MAYCPMCRSPNKYLKGQLIYLPRLRAIAAIGHECADRRQQRYADREFRARKGQEKDENFLLDALRNVKALAQAYESLDETASAARDAHRQLKRKAPGLMGALRAVKGGGGRLRVYRDIPGAFASGSSGLWREEIVLGTLKGTIACTAAFNPAKEIDAIVQRLRACNFPDNSDEGILVYIVTLTEQERAFAVNAIRHAAAQLPRIRRRIEEFWSFFDAANLGLLAEWGAHDLQPEQFSLRSHGENGVLSVSILRQGEFARIVVDTRKFLRPETG